MKKHIVITGVTKGLGRALCDWFIRDGHTVSGCGRSVDAINGLSELYPAPHAFHAVDVTDMDAVGQWAEKVCFANGSPDLLINNAAIINKNAPLWEVPPSEFSQLVDINIKGVFHVIHAFLPLMIRARKGIVVNLSSGWGRSVSPEVAPYCTSKWAIEGLTRALAQELPKGLAAIPLNPGVINTEMLRSSFGPSASDYPTPEKWAQKAAPFLLSLKPNQNGQPLTV